MSIDKAKVMALFEGIVDALIAGEPVVPPVVGPVPQDPTPPGAGWDGSLDGHLPAITSVLKTTDTTLRLTSTGLMPSYNCAIIDEATAKSTGYPLETSVGGGWAVVDLRKAITPGSYQIRVVDPVSYATSPWFAFTV